MKSLTAIPSLREVLADIFRNLRLIILLVMDWKDTALLLVPLARFQPLTALRIVTVVSVPVVFQ